MANYIQSLKKGLDIIFPRTKVSAVSDGSGNSLQSLLDHKEDTATISTTVPVALADNTIYNLTGVTTLTLDYPAGTFDCIINLTTAASGTIAITFPTSVYMPSAPTFSNGETWTLWVRNNPVGNGGIVTASKAVSAS